MIGTERRVRPELRQMRHQRGEPADHLVEPALQPERQRSGDLAPDAALPDALEQERHELGEACGQGMGRGVGHAAYKTTQWLK